MAQFIVENVRKVCRAHINITDVQHQLDLFSPYCRDYLSLTRNLTATQQLNYDYQIKLKNDQTKNSYRGNYIQAFYEDSQGNTFDGWFHVIDINNKYDPIISSHFIAIVLLSEVKPRTSALNALFKNMHPFIAVNVLTIMLMSGQHININTFDMLMKRIDITIISVMNCLPFELILLAYGQEQHIQYLADNYKNELPRLIKYYSHKASNSVIKQLQQGLKC